MTQRQYQMDIKRKCQALGVWRDEFERTQKRLAKIYARLDRVEAQYEDEGGEPAVDFTNKNGATNRVRNPLLAEIDILYEQALTCERELGLTAAALRRINEGALHVREESPMERMAKVLKMG